jgi:hypothetical protein
MKTHLNPPEAVIRGVFRFTGGVASERPPTYPIRFPASFAVNRSFRSHPPN